MKKWIKRIFQGALVALLLFGTIAVSAFLLWRKTITDQLEDGSTVVATSRGPVEYATVGAGRPLLYLHGSPGGYDQVLGLLLFWAVLTVDLPLCCLRHDIQIAVRLSFC